ncbi:hypothetical protein BKI52_41435 [marine bacterium AO1-C]|nr:hypothetical protein BKI52_41435 [marine bacterium AO1-C]
MIQIATIIFLITLCSLLFLAKNKGQIKVSHLSKTLVLPHHRLPQIIRPKVPLETQQKLSFTKQYFNPKELLAWKVKLEEVMIDSKPYLNPTLTLADLATILQTDNLTTSRIIHEGFQLCFYDFINTYRIEHFVQLSKSENYQYYTTLGLAYEAGFNAKSTFYKVFKKLKNTTPAMYLKLIHENKNK